MGGFTIKYMQLKLQGSSLRTLFLCFHNVEASKNVFTW